MILTTGMADPIWTQADIDALKAVIRTGTLTVSFTGPPARLQTFQSLSAMRALLAEMIRQVNGSPTFRRVAFSKGFDSGGDR